MAELQEEARAVNGDRAQNSGYLGVKGHEWRRRHKGTFWHTGQCPVSHLGQQFLRNLCKNSQSCVLKTVHFTVCKIHWKNKYPQNSTCTLGCKIFMPAYA